MDSSVDSTEELVLARKKPFPRMTWALRIEQSGVYRMNRSLMDDTLYQWGAKIDLFTLTLQWFRRLLLSVTFDGWLMGEKHHNSFIVHQLQRRFLPLIFQPIYLLTQLLPPILQHQCHLLPPHQTLNTITITSPQNQSINPSSLAKDTSSTHSLLSKLPLSSPSSIKPNYFATSHH